VIHEIDESLQRLVTGTLNGSGANVAFEAPTREWAAQRNGPTVNLYLYDLREDVARRAGGQQQVKGANGHTVGRGEPPRSYRLSYLATAWTPRPQDEHRLLSVLLSCFLRSPVLPPEVLPPDLAAAGTRIRLTAGLPPSGDRSISDIWSALGGELKPSLDVVLTVPFDTDRVAEAGPPTYEVLMGAGRRDDEALETVALEIEDPEADPPRFKRRRR
jgi:hypothetical protein